MTGRTLAHFEIVDLLGRGGMGEVHRARDSKLGREVAIKVLPPELARDVERMARFRREAKVLASLNHPRIASLHGFEEHEGVHFLVMELAEGEDLAVRMRRGPIPVDEALDIARQIAEGLEEAHARGVVHRDLKPQNVKLGAEGDVKILDFGLAFQSAAIDEADAANSPTITAALTQAGTLLGTAAYMSPEQAAGRRVDARTDVWAFGVILYEMLTGQRLFAEESTGETLAAVIRAEPDWDALPSNLPPHVMRVLQRCLRKKPRERWASIADVRMLLDEDDASVSVAAKRSPVRWLVPFAVGTALGAIAVIGLVRPERGDVGGTSEVQVVRSSVELPPGSQLAGWSSPAVELSPDGRTLAFVLEVDGGQHLYVRALDESEARRVPDSDGAEGPFFSPDGQWLAFGAGSISGRSTEPRQLKKYSLATGRTSTVCSVEDYFGGTWRDDGTIFFVNQQPTGLWRVPAEGGVATIVGEERRIGLAWPQMLPGGDRALIVQWTGPEVGRIATIDLESGTLDDLGIAGVFARWTRGGHLIVVDREGDATAHRFDAITARVRPGNLRVLEDVSMTGNDAAVLAIAPNGTLVKSHGPVDGSRHDLSRLWRLNADGDLRPLDLEPDFVSGFDIAPDGRRLAMSVHLRELWVVDLERGTRLLLPQGDTVTKLRPLWTPDARSIAFTGTSSAGDPSLNLFMQPADGVQAPRRLESRAGEFFPGSWVPGTSRLLHHGYETGPVFDLRILEIDVEQPDRIETVVSGEERLLGPRLAPSGRWLAYQSSETGRSEVFLRSYPDLGTKIPVGVGGRAQWSPRGDHLYLERRDAQGTPSLWVADVTASERTIDLGAFRRVFDAGDVPADGLDWRGLRDWSVDPAGDGLLLLLKVPGSGEIHTLDLVQGWMHELESMLPAGGSMDPTRAAP